MIASQVSLTIQGQVDKPTLNCWLIDLKPSPGNEAKHDIKPPYSINSQSFIAISDYSHVYLYLYNDTKSIIFKMSNSSCKDFSFKYQQAQNEDSRFRSMLCLGQQLSGLGALCTQCMRIAPRIPVDSVLNLALKELIGASSYTLLTYIKNKGGGRILYQRVISRDTALPISIGLLGPIWTYFYFT